jgi:Transposase
MPEDSLAVMDMWKAFHNSTLKEGHAPQARIVYDKFHIMTGQDDDAPKAVRRLKRWTIALNCRIVKETFVPGASVAIVARNNNANANPVAGFVFGAWCKFSAGAPRVRRLR